MIHQKYSFTAYIENLVLWARSEIIGYAVNKWRGKYGILECWNTGMLEYWV